MMHNMNDPPATGQHYEIRLKGHLDDRWAEWFEGMTITLEKDGETLITGPVVDQAALHGLLKRVRDSGLPLISVNRVQFQEFHPNRSKKENKMNTTISPTNKIATRTLLSTLWIVVMINMLKADILSLYIPGATEDVVKTAASSGASIPLLMLGGAIMMEISILMIILSRVLNYGVNRWANIIVSLLTIAFVVGLGATYPHYIFIAAVEVACLLLIVWFAWKWRNPEN